MVVPGLYGFVSACKWITRMTLTTYDAEQAYWTERDWAIDAPIKISSRIDTPKPLSDSKAGKVVIGGIAWAQHVGIEKVEVRIDGEAWKPAQLGPQVTDDYWRQWYFEWDAEPRPALHRLPRDQQGRRRPDRRPDARRSPRAPAASRRSRSPSADSTRPLPVERCVAQVPCLRTCATHRSTEFSKFLRRTHPPAGAPNTS